MSEKKASKSFWYCGGKQCGAEGYLSLLSKFVPERFLLAQRHFETIWTIYSSLLCICLMHEGLGGRRAGITSSYLSIPQSVCSLCFPTSWSKGCLPSSISRALFPRKCPLSHLSASKAALCHWVLLDLHIEEIFEIFFEPHSDHALWKGNLSPECVSRQVSSLLRHYKILLEEKSDLSVSRSLETSWSGV